MSRTSQDTIAWACRCSPPRVLDSSLCHFCSECGCTSTDSGLRLFTHSQLSALLDVAFGKGVAAGLEISQPDLLEATGGNNA